LRCSRQGCESWGVQVFPLSIARFGRLAYLDHGEVTNCGMPRSRSHGCPTPGKGVAVGATWVASKRAGLNMTKLKWLSRTWWSADPLHDRGRPTPGGKKRVKALWGPPG
jgi:hypothetical protein